MAIIHRSEGMAKFLDYQRSRGRIARATWFNLIVTAAAITVLFVGQGVPSVGLVVFIAIAVIAGIMLAALSAFEIEVAWNARLHDASAVLAREDAQGQNGAIGTRAPS
jgi:hypothetical protein